MRLLRAMIAIVILLGGSTGKLSAGASIQQPTPTSGFPGMGQGPENDRALSPAVAVRQEQARNVERQKRLLADTNKLLGLATELKQDVDKTNSNVLSIDVIKKAEEIEKLAHSVKERMKG